jgi:hypothetical protein
MCHLLTYLSHALMKDQNYIDNKKEKNSFTFQYDFNAFLHCIFIGQNV